MVGKNDESTFQNTALQDSNVSLLKLLKKTFGEVNMIKKMNFFVYHFLYRCQRRKKYDQLLLKSQSSLMKEMDLKKFIMRQRL